MKSALVFVALLAICYAAEEGVYDFEIEEIEEITQFIETKEDLFTFLSEGEETESVRVESFSFKDCGGPNALTTITAVSLTPDPISLPGTISIGASFQIKEDFGTPLSASLKIEKKLFGKFITVPCVDNIGSCTYNGLCGDLEKVTCPDQLTKIGIDCRCPFKTKSYTLPTTSFDIGVSLPLPSGDYHIVGTATSNATTAACLDLIFTLK